MEGQGVAASSAPAADRRGESGVRAVVTDELNDPDETPVTSDVADGGDGQGLSGDDSHVMVGPGHPEASAPDYNLLPSSGNQLPQEPQLSHESQLPQEPMSPQQTESDKTDNIVGPDRDDEAPARDENTSQDQSEAGLAPPAAQQAHADDLATAPPAATPPPASRPPRAPRPTP